jgi:hypothetical protein
VHQFGVVDLAAEGVQPESRLFLSLEAKVELVLGVIARGRHLDERRDDDAHDCHRRDQFDQREAAL